jgi:hypothetical protein
LKDEKEAGLAMDKFIVLSDHNDKFAVTDEDRDHFEQTQVHYKYTVDGTADPAAARDKYPVGAEDKGFDEARSPHNKFAVVDAADARIDAASHEDQPARRRGWPLWKKLTLAAIVVALIAALAVGLGVGLTQSKSPADKSSDSTGQQDGGSSKDEGGSDGQNDSPDSSPDAGSGSGSDPEKPREPASWVPKIGDTLQIVIADPLRVPANGSVTPDVDIYDIDLFDNDADSIAALRGAGRRVLCYFSAGTWEDWRDDKSYFEDADLGRRVSDADGEKYVNISSPAVRSVMKGRIGRAAKAGCDGVDAAYVDSYHSENGLNLTAADAVSYLKFLSDEARSHGLAIGLKNGGDLAKELLPWVDYSLNEECLAYDECGAYVPFITAGKPVFNIEYPKGAPDKVAAAVRDDICKKRDVAADTDKFSTLLKTEDLDGWVMYCDGKSYETEVVEGGGA